MFMYRSIKVEFDFRMKNKIIRISFDIRFIPAIDVTVVFYIYTGTDTEVPLVPTKKMTGFCLCLSANDRFGFGFAGSGTLTRDLCLSLIGKANNKRA